MREILLICFIVWSARSMADLKKYKETKMRNREEVSSENCFDTFKKNCIQNCNGDHSCENSCTDQEANKKCEERDSRHTKKTWEVIGKGLSVGAGAAAVALDKPMDTIYFDPDGKLELSPYAVIWNRPSFMIESGGGIIESGAKIANVSALFRSERFGFGLNADYLWDKKDNMTEIDLGPTVSFASSQFMFTLQPSFMSSMASGEKNVYGGGLRSYTHFLLGQSLLYFNPELGYVNKKWCYDLKLGFIYRFTPSAFIDVGYSYRDVVDFKDFNISSASLQGGLIRFGYRFN